MNKQKPEAPGKGWEVYKPEYGVEADDKVLWFCDSHYHVPPKLPGWVKMQKSNRACDHCWFARPVLDPTAAETVRSIPASFKDGLSGRWVPVSEAGPRERSGTYLVLSWYNNRPMYPEFHWKEALGAIINNDATHWLHIPEKPARPIDKNNEEFERVLGELHGPDNINEMSENKKERLKKLWDAAIEFAKKDKETK